MSIVALDVGARCNKEWSDALREETCLRVGRSLADGVSSDLHLKNHNGAFGVLMAVDLAAGRLVVRVRDGAGSETLSQAAFGNLEGLVSAGWVID